MNKIMIALAATAAIAVAAPAAAQSVGADFEVRTEQLQSRLEAGLRSGAISRAEAVPLREQLRQLTRLERQYARGGLNAAERADLRTRSASLRQNIAMAARGGDDRWGRDRDRDDRFGRDCPPGLEKRDNGCLPPGQVGRDGRDGRWEDGRSAGRGDMVDRNRDGYDDRDLNRDRRIDEREWRIAQSYGDRDGRYDRDDDRYDRDDRNNDRDTRRGGIGGAVDGLLGRDTLRVGQRVTADARLGAVPAEHRDHYRDGSGAYYRSDGRAIYQIDARSHTVLRVFAMR